LLDTLRTERVSMMKYLAATILLAVYVAGSVWAVQRTGMAYRETLNRERRADIPVARTRQPPRAPPTKAESIADAVIAPPSDPAPTEHKPLADPAGARAPMTTAIVPPKTAPSPSPARAADPLWNTPEMKRVWDLSNLKAEDEKRLGQALHDLILSFHGKVKDGALSRRVDEAAEPFVAARTRKDIDYTFTVLDSDAINAFSHPGGYVYVTSGLVKWIGEDQICALEFVLAHEIAHVDLRHALTCLRDPGVKKLGLGTLPQFLLIIFPWAYHPDQLDFEADRWADLQMQRLDRTKRERLAFLRKLEGFARDEGFENDRAPPELTANSSPVENHLRAHPAAYKRLKQLKNLTAPAPAPARAR
jgi:hypothetical protein